MGQLIPWLQVTISGSVYVLALYFLLLSFNRYELDFKKIQKKYIPYTAILLLFFSYVVGYAAYLVSEKFIFSLHSEFKGGLEDIIKFRGSIPDILYKSFADTYSDLILFRHLIIATSLLSLSLLIWLTKNKKWGFIIDVLIFWRLSTGIFWIAYFETKENFDIIKYNIHHIISSCH